MESFTRGEYVSLGLPTTTYSKPRRSLWRWWLQLSRFQRTLIYVATLLLLITAAYFLPGSKVKFASRSKKLDESPPVQSTSSEVIAMRRDGNKKEYLKEEVEETINEPPDAPEVVVDDAKLPPKKEEALNFSGPTNERQTAVVAAFRHAWKGYHQFAWGHDHLKPISETHHDWFGLGLTIVDSLDTMYIMGLKGEYKEARDWVAESLKFNKNQDVNLFEVTIRILGGLLSIYHLSGDKMYLDKAIDLGNRLMPCFQSPSGVPYSDINLLTQKAHSPKWSPDSSTSEVTTLQLEFRDLSRASGDTRYEVLTAAVSEHVHKLPKKEGLVPIFINANTGVFRAHSTITMGARGDSYYEYLLKQWIQTGRQVQYLEDDYSEAVDGIIKNLARRTSYNKLLFVGELLAGGRDFKPKMDHLACFLPGTLALGTHHGMPEEHMKFAEELIHTCYLTYAQQPTFLAPEITYFHIKPGMTSDMYVKPNDAHNLLRPETVESLWYLYHFTGNKTYQDWGWNIFQADSESPLISYKEVAIPMPKSSSVSLYYAQRDLIFTLQKHAFEKYTKVRNGYTSIGNVRSVLDTRPRDMMESFFLGETLKYFYLLFSDDQHTVSADNFVLNTEGHPLPILKS